MVNLKSLRLVLTFFAKLLLDLVALVALVCCQNNIFSPVCLVFFNVFFLFYFDLCVNICLDANENNRQNESFNAFECTMNAYAFKWDHFERSSQSTVRQNASTVSKLLGRCAATGIQMTIFPILRYDSVTEMWICANFSSLDFFFLVFYNYS